MRRVLLVLLLASWPVMAGADPPAPSTCEKDLQTTGEYAALVRSARDAAEIEIARLRAHLKLLDIAAARKAAPTAPTPENIP